MNLVGANLPRLVAVFFLLFSLASAATLVSECGTLSSGEYVLAGDVVAPPGWDCFVVSGAGVSLDCAGYAVSGSFAETGFKNPGFANVALRGCSIQNFSVGVSFEGATAFSGGVIEGNAVSGSAASLRVANAVSLSASQNSFSGPALVSSSSNLVFSSNTFNGAQPGALKLSGVSASSFSDNAVSSGGEYALWLSGSQGNSFNGGSFAGAGTDALLDSSPSSSFADAAFFHSAVAFAGASDGASFTDCGLHAAGLRWLSGNARVAIKDSVRVRVVGANASGVANALVSASTSSDGAVFFEGVSGAGGATPWFNVVVFEGTAAGGVSQSPFEVRAEKNGVSGSAFYSASPKLEALVELGVFSTPTPSASPSALPNASVSPSVEASVVASQAPWLDLPFLGGAASPSPIASVEATLSVANAGRGVDAAEPGAVVPGYASPFPSPTPAPECVWCRVSSVLPLWAWIVLSVGVAFLIVFWVKKRLEGGSRDREV